MALIRSCFLSRRRPLCRWQGGWKAACAPRQGRGRSPASAAPLSCGPSTAAGEETSPAHLPGPFLENSAEKRIWPKRSQGTWFQPRVLPTPTSGLKIEAKSNEPGRKFFPLRLTHTLLCLTFAPCPGESTLVTRNKELKKGVL